MAEPIELPVMIRIGDNPEREIGTIRAASWEVARNQIADAMREAADLIEVSDEEPT